MRSLLAAALIFLNSCLAYAAQDTYISIANVAAPPLNAQATFIASFAIPNSFTTGVKPVWTVSGAVATFIYADSTQLKVFVSIPAQPVVQHIVLTVTATVPETPPITVQESKTIVIGAITP